MLKKVRRKHRAGVVVLVAPEPLASVIRCQIEDADLEKIWQIDGHFGNWDVVAFPQTSVT